LIESSEAIIFNGINLVERFTDEDTGAYFIVNSVYGRGITAMDNQLVRLPKRPGALISSYSIPERILNVTITMKGTSGDDLRKRIDELNEILYTEDNEVPIEFIDEEERTYYGKLDAAETELEKSNVYKAELTFLCSDPYKYGPEETEELGDISTIRNIGTAEASPIFELTAKEKTTFAMISLGAEEDSEYNLIGTPVDLDEVIVDERTVILEERGESLDTWSDSGVKVDGSKAEVTGTLGTDGTGVVVLNYGSPSSDATWYGPALLKEINPIQDFEVEMRLRAESKRPSDVYRIEFYLFDENMDTIGKMAIWDNSQARYQYVAEGRIGDYVGKYENYLISSRNYNFNRKHFHGLIRMRRVGRKIEFYVARTAHGSGETGRHYDEMLIPFTDNGGEYQGDLKYVQIHIGTHQKGTKVNLPRINNFKVTEISEATVDQTPYILYPDDVVTFDHKEDDIRVNGESIFGEGDNPIKKDFGGDYFGLDKGFNEIIVTPSNTFESKVTFRDKYL